MRIPRPLTATLGALLLAGCSGSFSSQSIEALAVDGETKAVLKNFVNTANQQDRTVLLYFTLQNCPPCDSLSKNVLTRKEWKDFADRKLIIRKHYFPNNFTSEDVKLVKNMELLQSLNIDGGFPFLAVLNPAGVVTATRNGYGGGSAQSYIDWIEKNADRSATPLAVPAAGSGTPTEGAAAGPVAKPEPPFRIKAVMGSTVLIQIHGKTYTFKNGESLPVTTPDGTHQVTCNVLDASTVELTFENRPEPVKLTL